MLSLSEIAHKLVTAMCAGEIGVCEDAEVIEVNSRCCQFKV